MKILVVTTMAPFVWGGAEELATHLVRNLELRNFNAELLRLPFQWEPYTGIPGEVARYKAMDLSSVDHVITMKFPAYHVKAKQSTPWLVHQYRQAYDMWDSPYSNLPHDAQGRSVRDFIRTTDDDYFRSRERVFTISAEISERLLQNNGVHSVPLRAPINDPELFLGGDGQGYILAAGRVNPAKRQHLLVEAMALMPSTARLIVAGPPETPEYAAQIRRLVEKHDLADRVKLDLRFLSRGELADYVNNATAVAYIPFKEDSYGYVTMEAFEAGKPVITCVDAGELLDIVHDQKTGFVTGPNLEELAAAMAAMVGNPALAKRMGGDARHLWRAADISWSANIDTLLGGRS
ncbi:glycosyltransferase involved in cell wall biosynthesis [Brevundimonas sp. UYEF29]|uniref:glycosyltransferase family 4 protein n=1 Tax=Brevundimonas sp. UYEF29 TaxID=3156346 RepID=UPI0033993703